MDPLDILRNPSAYSGSSDFSSSLASVYAIFLALGTIGILISIIICGIKLSSSKNANTREETKKEFFLKLILGVLLFAFTGILGLVYTLAKGVIPT